MPAEWRLQVLGARIAEAGLESVVTLRLAGLFALEGEQRSAVTSALLESEDFPVVLVGHRIACAGAVDPDAVIAAVRAESCRSRHV
ncbi:MAG: hypothetical protein IBX62_00975 [Coriobacteriia bacterium]|nr:hypothetical protein [Coriobacteriia bacterium]